MLLRVSLALGVLSSASCVELDPANDVLCEAEGDCTAELPSGPAEDLQWGCLDQPPPTLPTPRPASQPVAFLLPVLEWGTLASLAGQGLTVDYCTNIDFPCANPLGRYVVRDGFIGDQPLPPTAAGAAGLPIAEGFFGFIKFTVAMAANATSEDAYVPVTYYLGGSVSGDVTLGPIVLMLDRNTLLNVVSQSFQGIDLVQAEMRGIVVVGAVDCMGAPVNNARIEINQEGVIPFVLPASRIPIRQPADAPLFTGTAGLAGYLNVPPGAVEVRAYRGDETEPFGVGQLGSVPGEISVIALRPPFLNNANVVGGGVEAVD